MNDFCFLLSNGAHLDVDGSCRVCCLSKNQVSSQQLQWDSGRSYVDASWIESNCRQCIQLEKQNFTSMRQLINRQFQDNGDLAYLDLRISNNCNMACLMCSPLYSSLWERKQGGETKSEAMDPELVLEGLDEDRDVFLHLSGGEPFLVKENIGILAGLLEKRKANRKISVQVTTNLSVLPEDFLRLLGEVDFSRVCVSLDAVGLDFDFIRAPVPFRVVDQNLRRLLRESGISVVLQPTISVLNIFGLKNLLEYISDLRHQSAEGLSLYPHPLFTPEPLSLFHCPPELSSQVASEIEDLLSMTESDVFYDELTGLLNSMKKSMGEPCQLRDMTNFLKEKVRVRAMGDGFLKSSLGQRMGVVDGV